MVILFSWFRGQDRPLASSAAACSEQVPARVLAPPHQRPTHELFSCWSQARVCPEPKKKHPPFGECFFLVPGAGLEPATSWL